MSNTAVFVYGDLADHGRGRNLAVSFGAQPTTSLPDTGAVIVFAKQFQTDVDQSRQWCEWAVTPGRLLVVTPPFIKGTCRIPVHWEVRRQEPVTGGASVLARLLSGERQHHLTGDLLPLERVGGTVVTGGWRRHPAAGLLAITGLPIWSLTALDHGQACESWLAGLYEESGKATPQDEPQESPRDAIELTPQEWSVLLHFCTGPFRDGKTALSRLESSSFFSADSVNAAGVFQRLIDLNLVTEVDLTPAGEALIAKSQYVTYARELRRLSHG